MRAEMLERLASAIARLEPLVRVAIDGVDGAGKTTLADELAQAIGPRAVRVSVDDFHRPPEERYARGDLSPQGYYLDSFDYGAFRNAVLSAAADFVLVDGIFLQRPELEGCWDVTIFVDVEPEEALRRAIERDGADKEERYRLRYQPGQALYLEAVRPRERADFVVENTDPAAPVLFGKWPRRSAARTIA